MNVVSCAAGVGYAGGVDVTAGKSRGWIRSGDQGRGFGQRERERLRRVASGRFGVEVEQGSGWPDFLGGGVTFGAWLEESCGSAEHVGGSGFVAMVGVLVLAGQRGVFWDLEMSVGPAIGRMRA